MTRTKTNLTVKIISFLLTLILVFYAIPSIVYAEAIDALGSLGGEESETDVRSAAISDKNAYEMSNLRTESTKTFKLPDGSFVAAQYPSAVHRKDSDGAWQDIDNSLAASGSEISTKDARVKFAKKITGNETLFTLHENNTKITYSLNGAIKKTKGEVIKLAGSENAEDTELSKLMTLENLNSKILYKNILDGVDLEYVLTSNSIKENIIVKEKKESYVYSFEIKLNNLLAELVGGDVLIKNSEGETAYVIPAPIIFDSNGVYAPESVGSYALISHGNGSYTLTVTADALWMNSAERAFPITVDPTVSPKADSVIIDTYIDSANPNESYADSSDLYVKTSPNQTAIAYWKINNLDFIPNNAYVSSAKITLSTQYTQNNLIGAHKVTSYWDSALTYNQHQNQGKGEITPYPMSYKEVYGGLYLDGTVELDITEAVKLWTKQYNYGVAFKIINKNSNSYNSESFCSYDSNSTNKPIFIVEYTNVLGLEDYLTYSSQSIGAIDGHVNVATGNLTFTIPTLTTPNSIMPYAPTLVYNSMLSNEYNVYPNSEVPYSERLEPMGFKWNIRQSVIKKNYESSDGTKELYIWTDGDGTEHTFYPVIGENYYVDNDGMLLTLTEENSQIVITDKNETKMEFIAYNNSFEDVLGSWVLTKISDSTGNATLITHNADGNPSSVEFVPNGCSSGTTTPINIAYTADGIVKYVYNSATGEGVIFKYAYGQHEEANNAAGTYLKEVIYIKRIPDLVLWDNIRNNGTSSFETEILAHYTFDYFYGGMISTITETVSDRKLVYNYYEGERVSSVTEYGENNARGQTVNFYYQFSYSEATSSGADDVMDTADDITTRFVFDNLGRVVSQYSYSEANDGYIYGATTGKYETQENIKNNISKVVVSGGGSTNLALNGGFELAEANGAPKYWTLYGNASRANSMKNDYEGTYALRFGILANATSGATQELYLIGGKHTVAFDIDSDATRDTTVTFSAVSLIDGHDYALKSFMLDGDTTATNRRVSVTFDVRENLINKGDRVLIKIEVVTGTDVSTGGTVYIDKIMLERGAGASAYSFVNAGSFEVPRVDDAGSSTLSLGNFWTASGQSYDYSVEAHNAFATNTVINGKIDAQRTVGQRIYTVDGNLLSDYLTNQIPAQNLPYNTYKLGAFARSYAASASGTFSIDVKITYVNKDGVESFPYTYRFSFLPGCRDWQYISDTFSTYNEYRISQGYELVKYIDVYCNYSNQAGYYAQFDNISVTCCNDDSEIKYSYYENGLLAKAETYFDKDFYEYDDKNNLIIHANDDGEIYEYTYNQNRTVASETYSAFTVTTTFDDERVYTGEDYSMYFDNKDISTVSKTIKHKTDYTYNEFGQQTGSTTVAYGDNNTSLPIISSAEYSANPNFFGKVLSETDTLGRTVRYYYDSIDGKLLATINVSSGDGVCYSYNIKGQLVSVKPASYVTDSAYSSHSGEEEVEYVYNGQNLLTEIITESTTYHFVYDSFGNTTSVSAENNTIVSYEYNSNNGKLKKLTYANGLSEEYEYNALELLESVCYNKDGVVTEAYSYEYSNDGTLIYFENYLTGEITEYSYTTGGKLDSVVTGNKSDWETRYSDAYSYNDKGEVSEVRNLVYYKHTDGLYYKKELVNQYTYDNSGRLTRVHMQIHGYTKDVSYEYDAYNRLKEKLHSGGEYTNRVTYTYNEKDGTTSNQVATYTSKVNDRAPITYTYKYDDNGNIVRIEYSTGPVIRYEYDNLGQLIREDNGYRGHTNTYIYDNAGNVIVANTYNFIPEGEDIENHSPRAIQTFGYSNGAWGDMLTSQKIDIIANGQTTTTIGEITYDELGNPENYYNGNNYTFTWRGRQMTSLTKDGVTYHFEYDNEGHRVKKTVGDKVTNYYYSGDMLVAELCNGEWTMYLYDGMGNPIGYQCGKYVYWYERNLQNDVVAIYDSKDQKIVAYTYDSFGNAYENEIVPSTIAGTNPFRYRGYYYDEEIGLYYLGTRYYDSATGRFLSPDSIMSGANGSLHGYNLYEYCFNNPIMYTDPDGNWPEWLEKAKEKVKQYSREIIRAFKFDSSSVKFEKKNFKFQENTQYNLLNAMRYAKYLKTHYYADDDTRTTEGIYIELQAHYIAYLFGNSHAVDGANMLEAEWSRDETAVLSEVIGSAMRIVRKNVEISRRPKVLMLY